MVDEDSREEEANRAEHWATNTFNFADGLVRRSFGWGPVYRIFRPVIVVAQLTSKELNHG